MKLIEVRDDPAPAQLPVPSRDGVLAMEAEILKMPQVILPLEHQFAPGIYARTIFIPAGAMLAGKIHKHEHFNLVLKGDIEVMSPDGLKRIKGPSMFLSSPGTKRVGYAFEDTYWTTLHHNPDDVTDIAELEKLVAVDTYEEFEEYMRGVG